MEALCGVSTWEEHTGERKWEVLGWRDLSEAINALAVPAWHRSVHRTVFYRNLVARCITTSMVRIIQTVIVPYCTA